MKEFAVLDPDGNQIRFGEDASKKSLLTFLEDCEPVDADILK